MMLSHEVFPYAQDTSLYAAESRQQMVDLVCAGLDGQNLVA